MIATYSAHVPSGELVLHLGRNPAQTNEIASVTVPASAIEDNSYVALEFPPIRDSRGQSYYFYVEARNIPPKYALTVWRSSADIYAGGRFYIDGQPQDQDICLRGFDRSTGSPSLENSLVASPEEGRWYLIQHGKRRWIPDLRWLPLNGYASQQPVSLSASQIQRIPAGAFILYFPLTTQIWISVYTALLFLFFFLATYGQGWLLRTRQRISAVSLPIRSLDSRIFLLAGFALLMWFREPSLLNHPRFWAEEGTTWFQHASTHSFLQNLFYIFPASGYFNLMANIGGVLSSATARFVGLKYAPLSTTIAAFLIQILVIAIILFGKSRLFTSEWRAVSGCLIVLFASTSVPEVWLNTINSMSYLGLIALLLLFEDVSEWPTWVKRGARTILVLCGLSAAYAIVLLPLFLLSYLRYRERERKVQCLILGACLLIQIGCVVFSKFAGGGLPLRGTDVAADMSSINVLFEQIALPALGNNFALVLFGALGFTGAWLAACAFPHAPDPSIRMVGSVSFLLIAGILWLLVSRRLNVNKLFLTAIFLILAVLTCVGSLNSIPYSRYAFLPGLVFLFLVLSNIESGSRRIRSVICMLVLAFALANGIISYRELPDPSAPRWSHEVAKWKADHKYKLRIWPSWSPAVTYSPN